MISTRVLLFLACVALTAYALDTCSSVQKGSLSSINATVKAELSAYGDSVYIPVDYLFVYSLVGVQVEVCSRGGPSEVLVTYKHEDSTVTVRRLADADRSVDLQLTVTGYLELDETDRQALHSSVIGVTDGREKSCLIQ